MSKITDKQRLDYLQSLMRRRVKQRSFSGLTFDCPLDSYLCMGNSACVVQMNSGKKPDDGVLRSAKTVRQAIDKAIAHTPKGCP